jgi:hypothetical protein
VADLQTQLACPCLKLQPKGDNGSYGLCLIRRKTMLNPQVLYIVEINDVDVSLAFSQASPDLHMVFPLPAVKEHGNHDGEQLP